MIKQMIVVFSGSALLIVVAVVVAIRERQPALPMPEASVSQTPAEVRVKAVERNVETLDFGNAEAPLAMLAHSPLTSVRKYGTIPALSQKRMSV